MTRLTTRIFAAVAGAAALLLTSAPGALAHNIAMTVWAFFGEVQGQIYFDSGTYPIAAVIEVFGPDGAKVGEMVSATNEQMGLQGFFAFTPTVAGSYRFYSDVGSGHVAEDTFEVTAVEFPGIAAAPAGGTAAEGGDPAGTQGGGDSAGPDAGGTTAGIPTVGLTAAEVQAIVTQAVQQSAIQLGGQIVALRSSIDTSSEEATTQGIIGGIGFILGLFGVGFFVVATMRLKQAGLTLGGAAGAAKAGSGGGQTRDPAKPGKAESAREAAE